MKKFYFITLLLLTFFIPSQAFSISEADLILSSNNVLTMAGVTKSEPLGIAIVGKKIVWVGNINQSKKIKGKHVNK